MGGGRGEWARDNLESKVASCGIDVKFHQAEKKFAKKKGKSQAGFCFNKNVIISVPSPEMVQ